MSAPVPDAALRAALEVPTEHIAEELAWLGSWLGSQTAALGEAESRLHRAWLQLRELRAKLGPERPGGSGEPDPGGLY